MIAALPLAQALATAGLFVGTLAYALTVKRRRRARDRMVEREIAAETGLGGLVRVLMADQREGDGRGPSRIARQLGRSE